MFMYAQMFYAYLYDVFFFNETFHTLQFIGGGIIIVFSVIAAIENKLKADKVSSDKGKNADSAGSENLDVSKTDDVYQKA